MIIEDGPENHGLIVPFVLRSKKKGNRAALRFLLKIETEPAFPFNSTRYRF